MQMTSPHNPDATAGLTPTRGDARTGVLDALGKRAVLAKLEVAAQRLPRAASRATSGIVSASPASALPEPVVIHVHDARLYGDVAFGGSVGAGEAYMRGYWTCDAARRRRAPVRAQHGCARRARRRARALHRAAAQGCARAQPQQPRRSRRNIAAHYDLGNEFFRLFLDETMMYSAAMFEHPRTIAARRAGRAPGSHLPQARSQAHRPPARDRHRLGRPRAARRARLWLPRDHHHHFPRAMDARARARARRPASRAASKCCARTTGTSTGTYDKLVSIEMIEAIGAPVLRHLLRAMRRAARHRRRDAAAGHHDRGSAL